MSAVAMRISEILYICMVNSEMIYDTIQKTIRAFLPGSRILLFGSRARGNHNTHSDYDLMVITPTTLTKKENVNISTSINKAIVNAIHAPIDILIFSEEEILQKQQLPGHIVRTAIREGVAL